MATVATFRIEAGAFPLGTVFESQPGARIELDRIVPTNSAVVPYFWVEGVDTDDVVGEFDEHPGVLDIRLVDSVDANHLLRVTWSADLEGLLTAFAASEVSLLSAVGTADEWMFEVRGDDRRAVAAFQAYCLEHDIPVELVSLHALQRLESGVDGDLTDAQREALALAYERGYFSSPRETTLEEIGDELGITRQAVASRIRRGTDRLVAGMLSDG